MLKQQSQHDLPAIWPHTVRLRDGRTLFVEMPRKLLRRDRDGRVAFSIAGIRFIDRLRAMAEELDEHPTPGHVSALRASLGLTQAEFGRTVGVNKLTVSRWERGAIQPGRASVAQMRKLRGRAAKKGVVIPV